VDISQVSFKISGSAGNASKSLGTLITRLGQLDTAFVKAVGSGNATITMLNGITGALGASASQAVASNEAISGLSASIMSLSNASKSVKLPTAQLSQHTAITKSATLATKQQDTETKKLSKSLIAMGTSSNHAMGRLGRLVRTLSQLAFVTILTRQAFSVITTGFRAAIDYTENLNLFMVALGENTTRATTFIKEMSESFYLDEAQLTRTQGLFYQISESLGLASEKAYTLSTNFTKLAYDLASFYNISVSDAVTKLQAGLVGETEPLRRIGIIITENNLAETARNLGIRKSIRNMTEQEKIQLRYVTALQQTQNAQTDLARTMTQPENLLRIFNEQWQVLIRNLGSSFIPMLQQVMPHIIGVTKALADMLEQFAKMRGYIAPMVRDDLGGYSKVVADEAEEQAKSTSKTAKELAKILKYTRDLSSATTGIDELNILGEQGGTAFDIGNLFETEDTTKASIDIELPDYDNAMEKAKGTFDEFVKMYDKKIRELWGNFKETFATSFDAVEQLKESIKGINFSDIDISVWDILNDIVTGVLNGITDIIEFGKLLYTDVFKPIMDLVAPKWMESLENGSFAEAVETIFLMFVGYKALTTLTGIALQFGNIYRQISLISAVVATSSVIKWVIDLKASTDALEKRDLYNELIGAIINGFAAAGLTGRLDLGLIAFGVTLFLAPFKNITDKISQWLSPFRQGVMNWAESNPTIAKAIGFDKIGQEATTVDEYKRLSGRGGRVEESSLEEDQSLLLNRINDLLAMTIDPVKKSLFRRILAFASVPINAQRMMSEMEGTSMSADDIKYAYSKLYGGQTTSANSSAIYSTPMFAKGGKPTKGDLFIAGEKGPELVTEHNGQTVVMNEKQLAERGVSFYANGVNVPEQTGGKGKNTDESRTFKWWKGLQKTMGLIADKVKDIYKEFKETLVGKEIASIVKGVESIVEKAKNTYNEFKKTFVGKAITATVKRLATTTTALYGVYKTDPVTFSERSLAGGPTEDQKSMALGAMAQIPYLGQVIGVLDAIKSGAVLDFFTNLPNFIEAGMSGFQDLLDGVVEALPAILEQIPVIITKIAEMFSNKDTINKMIQSAIQIVVAIVQALPTIIQALVAAIPNIITTLVSAIIENIPMFLKLGIVIGLAIIDGLVNIIISGINWLIDQLNKIPFVNIGHVPLLNLSGQFAQVAFAEGGFPMQGQMFIAREAGAELVGNIGGRTAVMNNDQIVESVSRGVYEAMIRAQQSDRGTVVVNLDGRKISNNQRRVSRTMGLDFGLGGF
jgi:hypothetical protein